MTRTPDPPCSCDEERAPSCAPRLALSPEEEQILARMRDVHRQARDLKARLRRLQGQPHPEERAALAQGLEQLRGRFRDLKEQLRQANRTKLIRLGHQP